MVHASGMEGVMAKVMMKVPRFFRLVAGSRQVNSPDLRNMSDRCLEDAGLTRCALDIEAAKPLWILK